MKHTECLCKCGHSPHFGPCDYEYWDDEWCEGVCGCTEYWCTYAGKKWSGTVRGGCVR